MIDELAESALEEIKRADHSIYVSLKYTRTVDIIKNTIKRLISAMDISIIQGLEYAKQEKKLPSIPQSARQRANDIIKLYPQMKKSIEFYQKLKNIDRADYTKKEEYRKNVALIAKIGTKKIEVGMEELKDFFDSTVVFSRAVAELTSQKKFLDTKKVTIIHPTKKPKKTPPPPKENSKGGKKGGKSVKKAATKTYKLNPHAKQRGFNGF